MNRFISNFVVASCSHTVFVIVYDTILVLTLQQQKFAILENVCETGDTHECDKSVISTGTKMMCVNNVTMIIS